MTEAVDDVGELRGDRRIQVDVDVAERGGWSGRSCGRIRRAPGAGIRFPCRTSRPGRCVRRSIGSVAPMPRCRPLGFGCRPATQSAAKEVSPRRVLPGPSPRSARPSGCVRNGRCSGWRSGRCSRSPDRRPRRSARRATRCRRIRLLPRIRPDAITVSVSASRAAPVWASNGAAFCAMSLMKATPVGPRAGRPDRCRGSDRGRGDAFDEPSRGVLSPRAAAKPCAPRMKLP